MKSISDQSITLYPSDISMIDPHTAIKLGACSVLSAVCGFTGTHLSEAQTVVPSWAVEKGAMGIMIAGMGYVISKLWNELSKMKKENSDIHKYYQSEMKTFQQKNDDMIENHLKNQVEATERLAQAIGDIKRDG